MSESSNIEGAPAKVRRIVSEDPAAMVVTTVRISRDLRAALAALAARERTTVGVQIEEALTAWVARKARRGAAK